MIREKAKEFALMLNELCPNSREFLISLDHLDATVFFANASIAREE